MESQLQDWLALQCQMIAGAREAVLVLGESEHASDARVARWPAGEAAAASSPIGPRLSACLDLARRRRGVVAQEGRTEPATPSHVAVPLVREGRVAGVVGVGVLGVSGRDLKAVADLLAYGLRSLVLVLDERAARERLDDVIASAGSLLDCSELGQAVHSLSSDLARGLGCERVSIGLVEGDRMKVVGLSSAIRFSSESDAVRARRAAMEEAADQDAFLELPAAPGAAPHATAAHEQLRRRSRMGTVCSLPLVARGATVGALVCEWTAEGALDDAKRRRIADTGVLCGPILDWMRRAEAGPVARARAAWKRFRIRRFGSDRRTAIAALGGAAALIAILAVVPGGYRISARASLEGRVQRVLVAAVDGYIAEANVRAGDIVAMGDVLARLDDRDLRLERRKWDSQRAQLEKEYRQALAGQDRTQVSILRSRIDKVAAQLRLAEEEVARTSITAPFDGIVVEGNLDQALGSPVGRGDVLFTVAPLDGYRIILKVDDRDIADIARGQRGRLALSALPGRPLGLEVERITPIATAEEGRNYFRVEAVLDEPVETLRPGMEGIAKVDVGERRLMWIWTHELLDWLRLAVWSFLP